MQAAKSSKLNTSKLAQHANTASITDKSWLTKRMLSDTSHTASRFLNQDHGNHTFFSSVYHFVTLSAYFKHDSIFNMYSNYWFHEQFHESNKS